MRRPGHQTGDLMTSRCLGVSEAAAAAALADQASYFSALSVAPYRSSSSCSFTCTHSDRLRHVEALTRNIASWHISAAQCWTGRSFRRHAGLGGCPTVGTQTHLHEQHLQRVHVDAVVVRLLVRALIRVAVPLRLVLPVDALVPAERAPSMFQVTSPNTRQTVSKTERNSLQGCKAANQVAPMCWGSGAHVPLAACSTRTAS